MSSAVLLFMAPLVWGAYPSGFTEVQFASGMSNPTAMAFAPDGRLFVCQQSGALRVVKNGAVLAAPFLTVSVNSSGERGLLGVAFHPDFANNNFLYIYYTVPTSPIRNRVSRFTANGDVVVPGSEVILFDLDNLTSATNHNGGAIHFGLDGKLYVAVGDNNTSSNSQSFSNRLGKMLRVNDDGSIPADNPFLASTTGLNRAIWAMGLRNPFTFNFHPSNGRMHINDVGQNAWEEVNLGTGGVNFGWPVYEGFDGGDPLYADPLVAYNHNTGTPTGCAITGGAFYTGTKYPVEYADSFFYADYCSQFIYRIAPPNYNTQIAFGTSLGRSAVDLQVYNGELYYLTRNGGGAVYRIESTVGAVPVISTEPLSQTVSVGQTATFTVAASGSSPLVYTWQRNGVDIAGAPDSPNYTTPATTAADNGATFRCIVSNTFGSDTSNAATLTVLTNQLPVASITQPSSRTLYTFNQTINFSATATDAEDGVLPASAFNWRVDFHHADHTHPHVLSASGKSGTLQTDFAETATDVFYRLTLTVTDSAGGQTVVTRDIYPRLATVKLQTFPAGLQLKLDGIAVTAPYSFTSVVAQPRLIEAVSPQTVGTRTYSFVSWSDGGAQAHTITVPQTPSTFTATFRRN